VTLPERYPELPQVPSVAEKGYPKAVITSWTRGGRPVRTPPAGGGQDLRLLPESGIPPGYPEETERILGHPGLPGAGGLWKFIGSEVDSIKNWQAGQTSRQSRDREK